jgi:hypothetical protein
LLFGLEFSIYFLADYDPTQPTSPTVTITDLAMTVGADTNHCQKKSMKSFSFSDFTNFLAEGKKFCHNQHY